MSRDTSRRFHSIQVTIGIAFSVISVSIIVGAILIAYSVTDETARIASRRYTEQLVKQIANNIESYIDYMDSVSSFVQSDSEVQTFLTSSDEVQKQAARPRAMALLATLVRSREDISLVGIFSNSGGFISHDSTYALNPFADPRKQNWYIAAQEGQGRSAVSSSYVQNVVKDRYRWVISLSREIISRETKGGVGVLLVDLNYGVINSICSSVQLGKRGYIFIVDKNGDIVYHPQQQLIYGGLKSENIHQVVNGTADYFAGEGTETDKFYSVMDMKTTGWKVVGVNFRDELVENRDSIRNTYVFWGLAFFIITIVLSILLSRRISKPIKQLRRSMQAVEQGNFDILADTRSPNEIGELGKDFNIMISEIKGLLLRVTEQQELKRKSELKALQMQINPHFLYNTLDSVIWMAEGGKNDEVIAMSSALARLFRLSISKGKEIIDIAAEIQHVTNYLTIQKIRYKDKLDYRIEVDPEIATYKTVKIILQPLVENAIYHGIKNKAGAGVIIISGSRSKDGIELKVQDDGVGMKSGALRHIQDQLAGRAGPDAPQPLPNHSGLGVRNVDERIKLYFGSSYGLDFESVEGQGTTVRVRLPAIEGELEA